MATLNLSRGVNLDEAGEGVTVVTEAHSGWSSGWVAMIGADPADPLNKFSRSFLRHDDSSLSRAGNGTKTYRGLGDGLYEADSVYRSYSAHRTIFRVAGGAVEVLATADGGEDAVHAELNGVSVADLRARRLEAERAAEARRLEAAAAAAAKAEAEGLPKLTGSEKQIKWAEQIRAVKLDEIRAKVAREQPLEGESDERAAAAYERVKASLDRLAARCESRWWIDHRDYSASSLLRAE